MAAVAASDAAAPWAVFLRKAADHNLALVTAAAA